MNRLEVQHLLIMIDATYPNFKVDDLTATIDAWHFLLKEYSAFDIDVAFKTYVNTHGGGFAPSVAELIAMTRKPAELAQMSAQEAWGIVRKAISRGNYYSEEDFCKFPDEIKRAVGSPAQLRIWASDTDFNESVESSNFYRRLATEQKRATDISYMPKEVRAQLGQLQQLAIGGKA